MDIKLPTKSYKIEIQPKGKTVFTIQYKVNNPKAVKALTKQEAQNMLNDICRFQSAVMRIQMELMAKCDIDEVQL